MGAPTEEKVGIPFTEEVTADELPVNCRTPAIAEYDGTTNPQEHPSRFENAALLHRYTDGIKCRVFVTTFARAGQQWFNQLPLAVIRNFREFRSLFLHQFASSRKHRKTELSLFSIRQKEGESLKDYLQRFNMASLEVPSAIQEVKANVFAQGLMDGDFFKSLTKKPDTKFDVLLARAAKYINMEDAQASKREGRGEKRKENKDENPSKKPKMDFKDKNPAWQRMNMVYTPLTIPITQALMAVEGKGLLSRPRSYKDGPRQPKSDKFCRFHKDYGHTTEECRHLKREIEQLIQNEYLQEYVCWEKTRGIGPYEKYETDKCKEVKNPNPRSPSKDMPRTSMMGKAEVNDPPRKGVIRMIAGGPAGGDSQKARKAQVREAYGTIVKEIMDVEPANDAPLIQFDQEEQSGSRISGNDALVITALLANYKIERVFIDSGSSADILFGEAYDQMQLGDVPSKQWTLPCMASLEKLFI
ncbi:UNVERIFIED_CONTAM: hypothetical protein Slati_3909200 [Sesamum latifolium]|uniref:Retrotransposon gag domain-containing protein n=1 Tax=Sesamum latifolium TaxID=2727402 RepID=A0AAW2TN68_9LAMI